MRGITLAGLAALAACAGCSQVLGLRDVAVNDAGTPDTPGDMASGTVVSYESTNTRGELARWDVDGAALKGTWEITDTAGTLTKTLTIRATCGNPDANYGTRSCMVTAATCDGSCAAGDAPPTGAVYTMLEVPGVALVVAGAQGGHTVLHIGLALSTDCPIPGASTVDSVYAHVGIGQVPLFGISRVTAGFNPFVHATFFMGPAGCTSSTPSGGCTSTPPTVDLDTGNGSETWISWTCTSGIQAARFASGNVRSMRSATGAALYVIPEGSGTVSFPMPQAAMISDFASKTFVGLLFSDVSPLISAVATTGPVTSAAVPINSIQFSDTLPFITKPVIKPAVNASSSLTSPGYPDFTVAPAGSYMNNPVLKTAYPTVSTIPGLFVVDGMTAPSNSRLVFVAGKQNGKLVGIGVSYDWVNGGPPPALSDYMGIGVVVLFEKP